VDGDRRVLCCACTASKFDRRGNKREGETEGGSDEEASAPAMMDLCVHGWDLPAVRLLFCSVLGSKNMAEVRSDRAF
jgi:hypothetical protein